MQVAVLFEDDDLLVIDKPAQVVVNRARSVNGETIQDWIEKYFKFKTYDQTVKGNEEFLKRSGVVHRLDKETSGCLIIAKDSAVFSKLQQAFQERTVKKTYTALVHGELKGKGEIRAPIGRLPWNRERFGIVPGGKAAVTRFKTVKIYDFRFQTQKKNEKYTLLELYPQSGRTHQIRVHLKYINHPIVGDYLYAGRKVQKADRTWCPRVFLHASKIEFPHPKKGQIVRVESPLPDDLTQVLKAFSD